MNTCADRTSENKDQAVANSLPKQQGSGKSAFQFVDNRPEAIAQRKLQEIADNSPQVKQLTAYQAMADNFTSQTSQRKENLEEESLQGRVEPMQKKENNTGLPDNLKSGIENISGYSMDDVKVHFNSDRPAQLNAHAYARGTDIHLASGQEKHLSHEAWHVIQQKQGRVKPTMQIKDKIDVNNDKELEKEADVMGQKALQKRSYENKNRADVNSVAQMKDNDKQRFGFVDNRPQVFAQREIQSLMNTCPHSQNTIQRATKDSLFGTFETESYEKKDGDDGKEVDLKLTFLPKATADSEKVGLVQVVKSIYKGNIDASTPNNFAKQTDKGYEIDQHPGNRNPLYATEDEPEQHKDNLASYSTDPDNGQHAIKADGVWTQKAKLEDEPTIAEEINSSMEFETSALAIEGNEAGTYYGSVLWGWKNTDGGEGELLDFKLGSKGVPSSNFLAAAKKWNSAKTSTGFYYTKENGTKVLDDSDKEKFTLPKDTKVKYIDDTEDGCIEMKVVGGDKNGQKGYIKVNDLVDRGDGKDTVSLPVLEKAPEEVKWFVKQFDRSKEYVVAAFIRIPEPRIDYMNFVDEVDIKKHGWATVEDLYRDLNKYKEEFKKYEHLERIYDWSRLTTVEWAMFGEGGKKKSEPGPPSYIV